MAVRFTEQLYRFPVWLRKGNIGNLLFSLAIHMDAIQEAAAEGMAIIMPGLVPNADDHVQAFAETVKIHQGPNEPIADLRSRVQSWRQDHARRGGPYEMLRKIHQYWNPSYFQVDLVYKTGRRYVKDTAGVVTRDDVAPLSFTDSGGYFLFLYWPGTFGAVPKWGSGGVWGQGVWGSSLTQTEVSRFRLIPAVWGNAHSTGNIVLFSGTNQMVWGYPKKKWGAAGVWGQKPERIPV